MLRAFLDGAASRRRLAATTLRRRTDELLTPRQDGALHRLDERYASRGPLKLIRDVPQLGILAVAAVFLAGTGAALALSGPDAVREREQAEREASLDRKSTRLNSSHGYISY